MWHYFTYMLNLNKNKKSADLLEQKWNTIKEAPGNENAKLLKASVRSLKVESNNNFATDTPLLFEFCFYNLMNGENNLDITFHLTNENGILVLVDSTAISKTMLFEKGKIYGSCVIPPNLLNEGFYTINRLIFVKDKKQIIYEHQNILMFTITDSFKAEKDGFKRCKEGVVRLKSKWNFYENN